MVPSIVVEERSRATPKAASRTSIVTEADRATLEAHVEFAKGSIKVNDAASRVILRKAEILIATTGIRLRVVATAESTDLVERMTLAAKRRDAVMAMLLTFGAPSDRVSAAIPDLDHPGKDVRFEVEVP